MKAYLPISNYKGKYILWDAFASRAKAMVCILNGNTSYTTNHKP